MRRPQRVISLVICLACACWTPRASAIDPGRMLAQYMREQWGSERGFSGGPVTAITQTRDGYLWIGTERGLIRFDGLSFLTFPQAIPTTFPIGPVQALMVDSQGTLWILLQSTKIILYHDGSFELGREEAEFGITSVIERIDGTPLLSSLAIGALEYRNGKYRSLMPAAAATNEPPESADDLSSRHSWATGVATHRFAEPNTAVTSMAETADAKVWLGTRHKGLFYISQQRLVASSNNLPSTKINCLLALGKQLWIGTDKGIVQWNGSEVTADGIPPLLRHSKVLAMVRDRDANIWVGTATGLFRVNAGGVSLDRSVNRIAEPVTALFEDREGSLWVGHARGIDCLRDSAFVTYASEEQHLESNGPLFVDRSGRVWFAPIEGGLHWMRGGKGGSVTSARLGQDVVYSITGGPDELWIGRQHGGLTHLSYTGGSFLAKTYTEADGLPQNSVYAVHRSRDGTVWAGTLNGGVSRLEDGKFTSYTLADGLGANAVTAIEDAPDGTTWFGTSGGLSKVVKDHWQTYTTADGLPSDDVSSLLLDSSGILWIGTTGGLAFLKEGHVYVGGGGRDSLREAILGIADDQKGSLWIATSNHVTSVDRAALLQNHLRDADFREYGLSDGLHGTEGVRRDRSVVEGPDGSIWFSMNRGLSVVVPGRATGETTPAAVHVENVSVDGNRLPLQGVVRIPASQRRITIDYAGLSLAVPDRVRFRYRLDGFDQDWSDPVSTRQAVYTNLAPGPYRFRVVASNSNGLWNGSEVTLPFQIAPAFWQTWWFDLSLLLALLSVPWLAYRLRLHQISRQTDMRVEERLGERTRIARELHDSLLQGFQGLLFHLLAARHMLPARPEEAMRALEAVLDKGDQALAEARNAVQDLRSSTVIHDDLAQSIAAIGVELSAEGASAKLRVLVEGRPRNLDPILRDEFYRFTREALRNAYSHAQAHEIEAELTYGDLRFILRIRDDGNGIDPKVLALGSRAGHWGLLGMRERANHFGGAMEVWSEDGAGTEIELTVPASLAYEGNPRPARSRILDKWRIRSDDHR